MEWRDGTGAKLLRIARYGLYAAGFLTVGVFLLILIYSFVQPPSSTLMIAHRLKGAKVEQQWVPIENISRHLVKAVVVSEDSHFCRHWGVDWSAVRMAIKDAEDGGRFRGASTIPMQTVKNLFLWPQRSVVRKGLEIPLAYLSSMVWSKRRMLEIYLNIAEWGPGIFGANAAARHHFGKSASKLTRLEAARLAATLPNPITRNARRPGPITRKKTRHILRQLRSGAPVTACVYE